MSTIKGFESILTAKWGGNADFWGTLQRGGGNEQNHPVNTVGRLFPTIV